MFHLNFIVKMQTQKSKSKKTLFVSVELPKSGRKSSMVKAKSKDLQEPTNMKKAEIKIGANFERHIKKYGEGSDYEGFAKRTAQKVTISRHDGFLCEKFNVYNIAHLAFVNVNVPEHVDLNNPVEIINTTTNPYELAKMWKDLEADARNYVSKETVISERFYGLKKADLERWGDKNWNISKKWFFEDAIAIDVKVEALSEECGMEISIDDVLEFVKSYKPGEYKNPRLVLKERVEEKFKEVVGFQIKDYYAEHLIKSCEFVKVSTDQYPF